MNNNVKTIGNLLLAGSLSLLMASCANNASDANHTDADTTKIGLQDSKDTSMANNSTNMASPQLKDADFVNTVVAANLAEIAMHKSAEKHAMSKEVKEHARMMEVDHSKMLKALQAYAAKNNISIPTEPDNSKKDDLMTLEKKTGKDYDKAYVDAMVDGHEKDIKLFQDNQGNRTDAELNKMIASNLPVLTSHLEMVKATSEPDAITDLLCLEKECRL